jgi:nucleoside-diphosphate-sugar epimerase
MNILITGGTGAMGTPLIKTLSEDDGNNIFVTSRSSHPDKGNVHFLKGDATEASFLKEVLSDRHYDVLVDFVGHKDDEFEALASFILNSVNIYIYIICKGLRSIKDANYRGYAPPVRCLN